mgnify:FL=1
MPMEHDFYKSFFEIEKKHWLMRARRANILDVLKKYNKKQPKDIKILDFGCASGVFPGELAKLGYDVIGLDASPEAIELGHKEGIKNIALSSGTHIDLPDNHFDIALLLDVVEHLEDPSWALKEIERVVKPNGIVIITVPAFPFLWGVMDEVAHHFRRYTIPTLMGGVAGSTDLSVVRKTYYNTFLFPPIALVRLFSRWFNIKGRESDFDLSNPFMDKIFFRIISLERLFLRHVNFPFGVAILSVFRKPKATI